MCSSVKEIDLIISELGRAWGPVAQFHLFGVKTAYFASGYDLGMRYVFSFDTAAWSLGVKGEAKFACTGELSKRFFRYRERCLSLICAGRPVHSNFVQLSLEV